MEIQFSRGGEPIGGKISNFLLEKVSYSLVVIKSVCQNKLLYFTFAVCVPPIRVIPYVCRNVLGMCAKHNCK